MTDVRLTATNPVDSSVVPVACNEKGELLLEEPLISSDEFVAKAGDTMTGNLTLGTDKITLDASDGVGTFAGGFMEIRSTGTVRKKHLATGDTHFLDLGTLADATYINSTSSGNAATKPLQLITKGGNTQYYYEFSTDGSFQLAGTGTTSAPNISLNADGSAEFAGDVIIGSRGKKWMIVESNGLAHLVEQTLFLDVETADNQTGNTQYPPLRDIPSELTMVEEQLQKVLEKLRMVPEAGWEVWDGSD